MRYEWFRCFPTNYLDGVRGLGDELGMAYTRIFMEMYAISGPVRFEVQSLKFLLEKRPQDVKRIVGKLIEMGKLRLDDAGFIHNGRTEEELARKLKWERNGEAIPASSPQSSPQSSDDQQAGHSWGSNDEKLNENYARADDHAGASRTPPPEAEAEDNKALPTAESFIINALPTEVSSLRPATNGKVEGSALAGERSLEGRSPPEPSEKIEPPSDPALVRKLVEDGVRRGRLPHTGFMAALQTMPKEDDDAEQT